MANWPGHVNIKTFNLPGTNISVASMTKWNFINKYFIQLNLTRTRNSLLCVRIEYNCWTRNSPKYSLHRRCLKCFSFYCVQWQVFFIIFRCTSAQCTWRAFALHLCCSAISSNLLLWPCVDCRLLHFVVPCLLCFKLENPAAKDLEKWNSVVVI